MIRRCALLADIPMDGDVQLTFSREPSFFDASAIDGHFVQVVAVRDKTTQCIIGMGVAFHFQLLCQ